MVAGHAAEDADKTCKFTLRDGARFHDRSKVLSGNAVASLKRGTKRDGYAIAVFREVAALSALSDRAM
jgi:hypothetical protein